MERPDYNPTPPRDKIKPPEQDESVQGHACDTCGRKLIRETTLRAEAEDYVRHFCGQDCKDKYGQKK